MTAAEDRDTAIGLVNEGNGIGEDYPNGHLIRMEYLAEAQVHATLACAAAIAEAGPQHETICPSCGAHIRARMADAGGARMLHNGDVIAATVVLEQEMGDLMPTGSYNWERFARAVLQSTGMLR